MFSTPDEDAGLVAQITTLLGAHTADPAPLVLSVPEDEKAFEFNHVLEGSAVGVAITVSAATKEEAIEKVATLFDDNYEESAEVTLIGKDGLPYTLRFYLYGDGVREHPQDCWEE